MVSSIIPWKKKNNIDRIKRNEGRLTENQSSKEQMADVFRNQKALNKERVRALRFPFCSFEEQKEIVSELEWLNTFAENDNSANDYMETVSEWELDRYLTRI